MTNSQPVPEQRSRNAKLVNFAKFPKKFELPDKRGFELKETEELIPAPRSTPIYKQSMTSMVWNISIGQLGTLPGCVPSQLLHTCSLAEHGRLQKVLDFLATTENISVINILLVLHPKHSSYWEEN